MTIHRLIKLLKRNTVFQRIYRKTNLSKKRKEKYEKHKQLLLDEFKKILNRECKDMKIKSGVFKGMKYISHLCGNLLAKLYGDYEKEIKDWIEDILKKDFRSIVNIGCAEGYYAVGLAKRKPEANIVAYDIEKKSRELCRELANKNNVENLTIKSDCDFKEINEMPENTLILCDIEGDEKKLLDPKKANFKNKTIIVEAHEFIHHNIVCLLISRFRRSHDFEIRYNEIKKNTIWSGKERRLNYTPWIKMEPKFNKKNKNKIK